VNGFLLRTTNEERSLYYLLLNVNNQYVRPYFSYMDKWFYDDSNLYEDISFNPSFRTVILLQFQDDKQ
jgi:hypothetical protein